MHFLVEFDLRLDLFLQLLQTEIYDETFSFSDHFTKSIFSPFSFSFAAATTEILGSKNGQDIYVKFDDMVNLTCVVSGTNAPPKHIFWYHEEKVRQKVDIFSFFLSFFLQVISYYSNRNGLGGVSIVTEKGEVTVSQLLIKGATIEDQVRKI